MNSLKQLAQTTIRRLAASAPWGVRQAMLDGYLDHHYDIQRANLRLLRMLNITEIGADGDRGVITSARNDRFGLLEYAATGTFAPMVTKEMLDFFGAESGTYMDVGANIGLTTIPFARNLRIRCLAFEPEPVIFGHLKRNVARNAEGASNFTRWHCSTNTARCRWPRGNESRRPPADARCRIKPTHDRCSGGGRWTTF